MRPVISYAIPDYTMRGVAYARQFAKDVFKKLDVKDFTTYSKKDFANANFEGQHYAIRGGNHLAGTHIMGTNPKTSVVDTDQRSWDHDNLYLVGGGSMPTIGTANITNTVAALCYKSAQAMIKQL
jgi:choline dehydrogenase-like flavoprotein